MWIFSLDGMLSIVRHYDHKDMFLVRSRTPGILERRFPDHPIIRLDDADYRYRVIVSYETVLAEMMSEMNDLLHAGYTNYKGACQRYGDPEYNRALGRIWGVMYEYQAKMEDTL